MNTPTVQHAIDNAILIKKALQADRSNDYVYDCMEAASAYNQNETFATEIIEALIQHSSITVGRFFDWLGGREQPEKWFADLSTSLADLAIGAAYVTDTDLGKHVDAYTDEIGRGRKVIVVGHSQGNFYANQAFLTLFGSAPTSVYMSVVATATPAATVAGGGLHTTLHEDFIYRLLLLLPRPMPSNTPYPDCGTWELLPILDDVINAFVCHSFASSYMVGPESRERILDHIVAALPTTAPPTDQNDPPAYLSFVEGNPRQPGDGTVITSQSNSLVTLTTPIGLGAATPDGLTITSFVSPISGFLGTQINLRATNQRCSPTPIGTIGVGASIDGTTTVNGIRGFVTNHTRADLLFALSVLNGAQPTCNFTLEDVVVERLSLVRSPLEGSVVDAIAFGFGQGNIPK